MTDATTLHQRPEADLMLFADCPFCLGPMPVDAATGVADCPACALRLHLAWEPAPVPVREPAPAPEPVRVLAAAA